MAELRQTGARTVHEQTNVSKVTQCLINSGKQNCFPEEFFGTGTFLNVKTELFKQAYPIVK